VIALSSLGVPSFRHRRLRSFIVVVALEALSALARMDGEMMRSFRSVNLPGPFLGICHPIIVSPSCSFLLGIAIDGTRGLWVRTAVLQGEPANEVKEVHSNNSVIRYDTSVRELFSEYSFLNQTLSSSYHHHLGTWVLVHPLTAQTRFPVMLVLSDTQQSPRSLHSTRFLLARKVVTRHPQPLSTLKGVY